MKTFPLVFLLVAASGAESAAETAAFLDIGAGARAAAMGGACTALADDAEALYWNPSGLARLEKKEISVSHAELFESVRHDFLAYAHPLDSGVVAGGLTYLSQGRIEGRDAAGHLSGGYDASDAAVSLAYARKFAAIDFGASAKYLRSHIGSQEAQGGAVDLGAKRRWEGVGPGSVQVGAALRNLGPGLKFGDRRDDLPLRVAFGVAYRSSAGHALSAEMINGPRGAGTDGSVGAEYRAAKEFFLRLGYATRTAIPGGSGFDAARGLSMGIGVDRANWRLDYAAVPSGELGSAHRFTLGARW